MKFTDIRDSIIQILGDEAAGRYEVFGYQRRSIHAKDLLGNKRNVQVYYSDGEFPMSSSGLTGPVQHHMTFKIDCMVSTKAQVDLSALSDPEATAEEKALALANSRTASFLADRSLDELFSIIWNILNHGENVDLRMPYLVGSRWTPKMTKDSPMPAGEFCILTGVMELTCAIDEIAEGVEPVLATGGISIDMYGNDETKTQSGVEVEDDYLIDDESGDFLIDDETGDYLIDG